MPVQPYAKSNSTVGTSPSTGQYLQMYLRTLSNSEWVTTT